MNWNQKNLEISNNKGRKQHNSKIESVKKRMLFDFYLSSSLTIY
jgi:hypothetical protein